MSVAAESGILVHKKHLVLMCSTANEITQLPMLDSCLPAFKIQKPFQHSTCPNQSEADFQSHLVTYRESDNAGHSSLFLKPSC